mgnify:CR=1 FL=1
MSKSLSAPINKNYESDHNHPRANNHGKPDPENHECFVNTELLHRNADKRVADEIDKGDGASVWVTSNG